jgi:Protein of unknown function (DUF3093)
MSKHSRIYKERSPWPIWLWLFLLFLAATLALAFWAALGTRWGWTSMIVQFIGLLVLSQRTILTVEVTNEQLKVGSAHIDRKYLGTITALTAEQMRQLRGPLSDPAGYMALRFWLSRGVKVEINDPNDPTPYWLISSKKAQPLAAALQDKD